MPSPIPQEIIDSCIDNLAFDVSDSDQSCEARKALFLCSLASRALGQRARYHIFSDIRIRPSPGDVRSQQLRDIMKEDPNICRFIRTLDIHIADKGPQTTATSRTGLPDILNMLSRRSGGRGIEGFTLHGNSNRNPWGRIDKEFLSALVNLIYNADSDEGSSSSHFRTLKFIQISGFKEVPTALITNCPPTIKSMRILYLSFVEDAKAQPSTLNKKRASARPSTQISLASPPKFVLEKFHFTGIEKGNVDSLATALLGEPLLFSQLEELDVCPQCAEDLAFVHRVIRSATRSIKVFTLETGTDTNAEYPGGIDLSLLPNLRVVKIINFIQYTFNGFSPLAPLFAFFDSHQTNNRPWTLEVFELDLTTIIDTKGMARAVTDSVHQWDKLDQDLTSSRFPHLREVNISVDVAVININEMDRLRAAQDMLVNLQRQLARLSSSPIVAVNIEWDVRDNLDDWDW